MLESRAAPPWICLKSRRGYRRSCGIAVGVVAALLSAGFASAAQADQRRTRVFLSCPQTCFEPYLRQELSYFDMVRDRYLSDVLLLIVRQRAANGGERIVVTSSFGAAGSPSLVERELTTQPAAPPDVVRGRLRDLILRVLFESLVDTEDAAAFRLSLPRRDDAALSQLQDPWDYWAISPELIGNAEAQSGFHFAVITTALTLRRTTELNKLRVRGSYTRQLNRVELSEGEEAYGDWDAWEARLIYARSLGEHWSVGFATTESANQPANLRAHVHGGPVVELNLFPYSENASRQLRVAYQVGPWMNWYLEESVAGLWHELRPYQAMSVVLDANQRWGSVQWAVQLSSFVDEPARYRLGMAALANLQLTRGFAFNVQGLGAVVRDQIGLRARPLNDVELLLGTAEQETSFDLQLELGIVYTFGSIHNTIVNPRFGRIDLQEE